MKALIVEDELPNARRLERMLLDFDYEVMDTLVSVKSAIAWFQRNAHPDILFLDIHLSDGLCFEIFDQMKLHCPIIFTTAYSNYSIKAFEYNSVSYLVKPIEKEKLAIAI